VEDVGTQPLVRGQWRQEVAVRVRELEGRLKGAKARRVREGSGAANVRVEALERILKDAESAIAYERRRFSRIQHWWTGAAQTRAWESVHAVEAGIVDVDPEYGAEVVPRLHTWLRLVLPSSRDLHHYEDAFARWEHNRKVDAFVLRQAFQAAIAANIEWHTSLRAFRNVLFYVAGGLLIMLLALAVWHAIDPSILPMCGTHRGATTCFGGASPRRSVVEVELVGAFGGLLSSAFLLAKLEKPPTRYNVLAPQIVLKAVAGAASALVGVLFLQSGVLVEPVNGTSAAVLLSYAIVFGFSQQLVTQLIDRQSASLLSPGGGRSS
jgi:hypothetical protein